MDEGLPFRLSETVRYEMIRLFCHCEILPLRPTLKNTELNYEILNFQKYSLNLAFLEPLMANFFIGPINPV